MSATAAPTLAPDFVDRLLRAAETPAGGAVPQDAEQLVDTLLGALERGEVRAAQRDEEGKWNAVPWVKRGILLGFRVGRLTDMSVGDGESSLSFVDKHTYPVQRFDVARGVRVVPGGSSVRRGAYVAPGVVCMPPMYVNVGAWIGSGTMVDSHALVGSCAQIGGVLEPVNAAPVVIEDDVLVGGNCGVYEGTIVRSRAVLAAGVILTRGTPVYDLVNERILRAGESGPLEIPSGAV
ncbi:MAG TPA: 2,3,4,5-tetrahydropyridine-2,6-dicarboxylate N-succinyltransferase, partial [Gemmatimonadaceae bacterium]